MDKLKMHTQNKADENYRILSELFPNAVTETINENGEVVRAIDADVLRQEICCRVVEGKEERYQFIWPDKKKSILLSNTPVSETLRLNRKKSIGKNGVVEGIDSENIYIEGDNLSALKMLRETYLGKIKMIYIDPPYNTGNDFVYDDDFSQDFNDFLSLSHQVDDDGNKMVQNSDGSGRYHTDWLNMIYSRLRLSKDLLTEDGVIFISIDDYEIDNMLKMCNEVFGASNKIACLIWDLGTGTTAGHFTRGHEYILCFARNKDSLPNFKNYNQGEIIRHGALKKISRKNPAVEISFPAGFEYEGDNAVFKGEIGNSEKEYILSPEMRFENGRLVHETRIRAGFAMKDQVEAFIAGKSVIDSKGQVVKRFYFNKNGILFYEKEKTVINPRTVLSEFGSTKNGTQDIETLLGDKYFDFPKPVELIAYLVRLVTDENSIVLDFFSGSATTGQAVMSVNSKDEGKRKFILVQIPETISSDSAAAKDGYGTLCDIGEERIKRSGELISREGKASIDCGFRVFYVDSSNMKDVYYNPADTQQDFLDMYADNIKEDRTPEDLLFQVMLDLGVMLSSKIEEMDIAGKKVFNVSEGFLLACFDKDITDETVKAVAKMKPYYAVFRDSSMANDSVATNFDQIFENISPDTIRKVL